MRRRNARRRRRYHPNMVKRAYRKNPVGTALVLAGLAALGVYVVTRKKGTASASGGGYAPGGGGVPALGPTASNVGHDIMTGLTTGALTSALPGYDVSDGADSRCTNAGGIYDYGSGLCSRG